MNNYMQDRIWKKNWFQTKYTELCDWSASRDFYSMQSTPDYDIASSWSLLLNFAHVLAQSDSGEHLDAALRIAHTCLSYNGRESTHQASAAYILNQLANRPALNLAQSRALLPQYIEKKLPGPAFLDWTYKEAENSIVLWSGDSIHANSFQVRLWSTLRSSQWVSFSAPTSAGKSFILYRWIVHPASTVVGSKKKQKTGIPVR